MAQVEVTRGSQRLSGFDFEMIFMISSALFGMFFLVRKFGFMQFGTLTWIIGMVSSIAACHFNMVVASHCG